MGTVQLEGSHLYPVYVLSKLGPCRVMFQESGVLVPQIRTAMVRRFKFDAIGPNLTIPFPIFVLISTESRRSPFTIQVARSL